MVPLSPRQRQESRRGGEFTGKVHLGRKEWGTERAHSSRTGRLGERALWLDRCFGGKDRKDFAFQAKIWS